MKRSGTATALIKSPLNYTGGKYRILEAIFHVFPNHRIRTFVDLFAGGFNVGINVDAERILCNDQIVYLIELYQILHTTNIDLILERIQDQILKYGLTKQNGDGYYALRADYNKTKDPIQLFVLACYAFNHQIRFNSRHEFNSSFGRNKSSYNGSIEKNLIYFCQAIQEKSIDFFELDFRGLDLSALGPEDLVYCDPPYFISMGNYNDGNRGFKDWKEREEKALLKLLDQLHEQGTCFILSNVLYHKGLSNELLIDWSKNYRIHNIDIQYSNCNYQLKDRAAGTVEVLITNY